MQQMQQQQRMMEGGDVGDPYSISPVQLQSLDTEQLRQLVLTLQRTTPNSAFGNGGQSSHAHMKASSSGMKHGLRINASSSPIIQESRHEIEHGRTLCEKTSTFEYRDLPRDELEPIQDAKRRAWNRYHSGKLRNSKKKNIQLGPNAPNSKKKNSPDHRGRLTSPVRRYSMEYDLRGELLQFDTSKDVRRQSPPSNKRRNGSPQNKTTTLALENAQQASSLGGVVGRLTLNEMRQEELLKQTMREQKHQVEEQLKLQQKWEQRVQREGLVRDNDVLSLFTPEQLVATSNDGVLCI